MAQQSVSIGSSANDGTGDPLRTAFTKINENFTEVYAGIGMDTDKGIDINNIPPFLGGGITEKSQ